jgi:hypothetical protein
VQGFKDASISSSVTATSSMSVSYIRSRPMAATSTIALSTACVGRLLWEPELSDGETWTDITPNSTVWTEAA